MKRTKEVSIPKAAKILGRCTRTVRRLITDGRLKPIRHSYKCVRIPLNQLIDLMP